MTPYWTSAKGEAELFNRTIGKAIQYYHAEGKHWRNHMQEFLVHYCTTPHIITAISPADIFLQYKIPNSIPSSEKAKPAKQDKTINSREALVEAKIKEKTDIIRNTRQNPIQEGDYV